ncbi:MAG: hypothetical protein HYZ58_12740 [Acidobacteria bacterium]|nr:hypothetical protein [Acidobacteriota bacterium]MBI3263999.1 hypothetical protein [Acidobacteriota bacterium]
MPDNPFFNITLADAAASRAAAPPTTVLSPAVPASATPVSAPAAAPRAVAPPAVPPAAQAVGVITTQQSAITFAGAPAAVTVVWKVLGLAIPAVAASTLFAIVLSLAVGMLIYWQSATFISKKDKIAGFVFAFINSFAIAAATLGINTAVAGQK